MDDLIQARKAQAGHPWEFPVSERTRHQICSWTVSHFKRFFFLKSCGRGVASILAEGAGVKLKSPKFQNEQKPGVIDIPTSLRWSCQELLFTDSNFVQDSTKQRVLSM